MTDSPPATAACPYCGAPLILAPRDPFDFDGIEVENCSGCRSYTEPTGRLHHDKGDTR